MRERERDNGTTLAWMADDATVSQRVRLNVNDMSTVLRDVVCFLASPRLVEGKNTCRSIIAA